MKKLRDLATRCVQSGRNKAAAVGSATLLLATQVHAALPAEVDTAITSVVTDGVSMVTKGYALVGAIGGALIVLGLFAKVLKKH